MFRLEGVAGVDLDPTVEELRFSSPDDAWAAAETLFTGQGADGPHGAAAVVQVVDDTEAAVL